MDLQSLLDAWGPEVDDPEEETFLLFAQDIPSQNLGFVDARASQVELAIAGVDYTIHQSPTILTSNRTGGTTGAVLWKITPLFAEWVAWPGNPLWAAGILSSSAQVLELGCGISGLVGLVLRRSVNKYVLTDQSYVAKFVEKNLEENATAARPSGASPHTSASSSSSRGKKSKAAAAAAVAQGALGFVPLDWEQDEVSSASLGDDTSRGFDVVIACDCIYNEALIRPLVETCAAVSKLRPSDAGTDQPATPTVCLIAQQLRDPEIFEGWIKEFHKYFSVWRVPESSLSDSLKANAGFVLHCGVLRKTPLSS